MWSARLPYEDGNGIIHEFFTVVKEMRHRNAEAG